MYILVKNCVMIKMWSSLHKSIKRFSKYQEQVLMKMFQTIAYPRKEEIRQAATSLSTSKERVQRWLIHVRFKKRAQGALLEGE